MIRQCMICCSLLVLACTGFMPEPEDYNPDYEPEICVFSVISNDESFEFVIVERTLRINEHDGRNSGSINSVNPIINDAKVFILCDNDSVQFNFSDDWNENFYATYPYKGGMYIDTNNQFHAVLI